MSNYSIDDQNGDRITAGLQGEEHAMKIAQELANDRGESVYVYESGEQEEVSESVEIKPEAHAKAAMGFTVESTPEVQAEYSDEWQTTMTIDLMREDGETGDVWICAGVPDSDRGSAEASGSQRGYLDVWVYGDSADTWCPRQFMAIDEDGSYATVRQNVLDAVRKVAIKTHRERMAVAQ